MKVAIKNWYLLHKKLVLIHAPIGQSLLTNDDLVLLEKFQVSLLTCLSDLKAPSTWAYNVFTHFRHNHILGINIMCLEGVPVTRLYHMYFLIDFSVVARYVSRIRYVFARYGVSTILPHIWVPIRPVSYCANTRIVSNT